MGLGLEETDAEVELVCDRDFLVSRDYMTELVEYMQMKKVNISGTYARRGPR